MNKLLALTVLISATLLAPVVAKAEMETLNMPVPKQNIRRGEVITTAMLTHREYPVRRVSAQMIDAKEALIGMEATRTLRAQAPVQMNAVRIPPDVTKNSKVFMKFDVGGLKLSASARAMEDGTIGEVIRLQNLNSNKVIYGTITDKNTVEVEG